MATQAEKDDMVAVNTAAVAAAQTSLDHANALVVDTTDVAALQQQVSDLTAANATLTQQLADANAAKDAATQLADSAVAERDAAKANAAALQAKIDAARTAAQADKDADAANVAGQGVLDALA